MITIAVLTPHAEAGPEVELPAMAPGQVVVRLSRIPAPGATTAEPGTPPTSPSGLRALTDPSVLDRAAAAVVDGSVEAIGYASTSTGYAVGFDAEAALAERLAQRWSLPVASTSLSACAALQTLHVQQVALVHPPWFSDELNVRAAAYFRGRGFDVISSQSADLVNDPSRIEPGPVIAWISEHVSDQAEGVYIGGNGFRAASTIEALEQRLGRPVLQSNQGLLWSILAKTGADVEIGGHGRLFGQRSGDEFLP